MISTKAHVRNAYTYVHTFMYVSWYDYVLNLCTMTRAIDQT